MYIQALNWTMSIVHKPLRIYNNAATVRNIYSKLSLSLNVKRSYVSLYGKIPKLATVVRDS